MLGITDSAAQKGFNIDDPAAQGGIAAGGILAAVIVAGIAVAAVKANKAPIKRTQRKHSKSHDSTESESIDNPTFEYNTIPSAATPIAGAAIATRIPINTVRLTANTPVNLPNKGLAPMSNVNQPKLQVARNSTPSIQPGNTKPTSMNANVLKQFETYDKSHFQAQRIRQQPRGTPVRTANQPRVSITQTVQDTYSSPTTHTTNPIRAKVEFDARRVNM